MHVRWSWWADSPLAAGVEVGAIMLVWVAVVLAIWFRVRGPRVFSKANYSRVIDR